uniref:Uncharacterized protein n=1 Tax=Arundo donax TaxID=35708 RepID=A0A0A9FP21_ARUDO
MKLLKKFHHDGVYIFILGFFLKICANNIFFHKYS